MGPNRTLLALVLTALFNVPATAAVMVSQSTLPLPTYDEGLPDENPSFDFFHPPVQNYPYTLRHNYATKRSPKIWRSLELENEYLKCIVLPDLGGRVYTCVDKLSGREMFYANTAVKKVNMASRGAWWAAGTEHNFPVGHPWATVSPVDFATVENADGSASVFVGNTDLVDGLRWVVENTLRPGAAILEQRVTLSNPTAVRRRYSWWNAATVEAAPDTRFYFPTYLVADHGPADMEPWPANRAGVDRSMLASHTEGPVARFTYGSREPFMAIYSKQRNSGTVHFADPKVLPGKKLSSWGAGIHGAAISKQITDSGTVYVEMQSGLFENPETFGFLEPRQVISFTEYWMPVRALGGVTRATLDAAVFLERGVDRTVRIALNAFHAIPGAKIRLLAGDKVLLEEQSDLAPAAVFTRSVPDAVPGSKYEFELLDNAGHTLLKHSEGEFNATLPSAIRPGNPSAPEPLGIALESRGDLLGALKQYEVDAASNRAMDKAAGRVLVTLLRYREAIQHLLPSAAQDAESRYYLGVAYARSGDDAKARAAFEALTGDQGFGAAASMELASLLSRAGLTAAALKVLNSASPLEIPLLVRAGDMAQALRRLQYWAGRDPANIVVQVEQVRLGAPAGPLWRHLAASPDRVLDAAGFYMDAGLYPDALRLIEHNYAPADPLETEPGALLPHDHPLVSYYRGFCRLKSRADPSEDFGLASQQSTRFVFPHRPQTFPVLQAALQANPSDATAHFLLGSMHMYTGSVDPAFEEWQQAYQLDGKFPALHALLGRVLLEVKNDRPAALKILKEGLATQPANVVVQNSVRKALGEKAATVSKTPGTSIEIASLALSMLESGRLNDAYAVFTEQNFPRDKESVAVRETYIEIRLQQLFVLAKSHKCEAALIGIEALNDEDRALPFTLYGFGAIIKSPRLQYALGEVESLCGSDKAARKRWSRLTKLADGPTLNFVYGQLAAARLSNDKTNLKVALEQVNRASKTGAGHSAELAYAQGLLESALSKPQEAQQHFSQAAELAKDDIVLRHLANIIVASH